MRERRSPVIEFWMDSSAARRREREMGFQVRESVYLCLEREREELGLWDDKNKFVC